MSYNSKYTGKQVEDLLDKIEDLENRPSITEQDIADMGFTKNKGTITQIKMNGVVKGTDDIVDLGTVITAHQDISGKQDIISDIDQIRNGAALGATALQSYTEKYTGTYSKPSTGIPKIDLSNDVQESLTKADNALQEETYKGTVTTSNIEDNNATIGDISTREVKNAVDLETDSLIYFNSHAKATYMNNGTTVEDAINDKIDSVKINGIVTKSLNGMVDLGTVITEHQDISDKLNKTEASENYLTKTDAQTMYLGKTEKASNSISADTAIQATKDSDGNVIISTYATKDSIPVNASKRISDLENGTALMPIILLAGTIYRSSPSLTTWYFIGSRHSAIAFGNPTATVDGGVIRFQFNAVDGRSIQFVSVTANVQATGEATSYTNTEYRVRSGGANWLYTHSTGSYLYIRGWCQHSQNGDSAASAAAQWDGTASDGITRISVIAVGYAY